MAVLVASANLSPRLDAVVTLLRSCCLVATWSKMDLVRGAIDHTPVTGITTGVFLRESLKFRNDIVEGSAWKFLDTEVFSATSRLVNF